MLPIISGAVASLLTGSRKLKDLGGETTQEIIRARSTILLTTLVLLCRAACYVGSGLPFFKCGIIVDTFGSALG